jgi:hypothetical protein
MWDVPEALGVLTGNSIAEALRFAYAVSDLLPAGLVVGGAAVVAGLLGATAVRKTRVTRTAVASRAQLPWVLGMAVLAASMGAAPSDAAVLCRTRHSAHLVLRTDGCRGREHAVDPSELGLGRSTTCVQDVASAWNDVTSLRTQLEDARRLAIDIAAHPWNGAETWLTIAAAQIVQTLARLDDTARALGVTPAADEIAQMRSAVTEHWSQPADACSAALAILPQLEAALPIPAAG